MTADSIVTSKMASRLGVDTSGLPTADRIDATAPGSTGSDALLLVSQRRTSARSGRLRSVGRRRSPAAKTVVRRVGGQPDPVRRGYWAWRPSAHHFAYVLTYLYDTQHRNHHSHRQRPQRQRFDLRSGSRVQVQACRPPPAILDERSNSPDSGIQPHGNPAGRCCVRWAIRWNGDVSTMARLSAGLRPSGARNA